MNNSENENRRPPKRQTAKKINFRELADFKDSDEDNWSDSEETNCKICKNSTQNRQISSRDWSWLLRRIFVGTGEKFDFESKTFCHECVLTLERLKEVEDESQKIRTELVKKFSESKKVDCSVEQKCPTPVKSVPLDDPTSFRGDMEHLELSDNQLCMAFAYVIDPDNGEVQKFCKDQTENQELDLPPSEDVLFHVSANGDPFLPVDLSELSIRPRILIPTVFISRRELVEICPADQIKEDRGINIDSKVLKQLGSKYDKTQAGKLFIASSDILQMRFMTTEDGTYCCNQCQESLKSVVQILEHLVISNHTPLNLFNRIQSEADPQISNNTLSENSQYSCPNCDKKFSTKESLDVHLNSYEGKPFSCPTCGKGFTRKAYMLEHLARHKGLKDKECPICHKKFYRTSFWRHMSVVHAETESLVHTCPKCDKKFRHHFLLKVHLESHLPYNHRKFTCEKCPDGKRFPTHNRLRAHQKQVHVLDDGNVGDSAKLCPDCGLILKSTWAYNTHRKLHHSKGDEINRDQIVICPECHITLKNLSSLKRHLRQAHSRQLEDSQDGVSQIKIELLGDLKIHGFDDVTELALRDHSGDLSCAEDSSESFLFGGHEMAALSADDPTQFLLRTSTGDDLGLPGLSHQNLEMSQSNSNSGFFPENIHEVKLFSLPSFDQDSSSLVDSFISKEKLSCEKCGKIFASAKTKNQHDVNVHANKKPLTCKICQNVFSSKSDLKDHSKVHNQEKPFVCQTCGKDFKLGKDLKRHFRIHTGEKPFACNHCDKRFSSSSNLSEHRTLHTGQLNYECQKCKNRFRLWNTMRKHSLRCNQHQAESKSEIFQANLVLTDSLEASETYVLSATNDFI